MPKPKSPSRTAGIVAYIRVSTDEQAVSGLGLEAQRVAIEADAARRGLPVLAWHEDAVSGKNLQRPGLGAALSDLGTGQGSLLVVAKLDRLSRSVHDATGLMQLAEKQSWGLVALDAQIDTSTPQGSAMVQVMAVFAELERRLIGERTKAALAVKRSQGVKLGRPRMIDEEVAVRIRTEHSAGASWSAIARGLNTDGVPTARGREWYPATVRLIAQRDEPRANCDSKTASIEHT
jgi:DNA invertase Pin-like site-specific DNA recombinase